MFHVLFVRRRKLMGALVLCLCLLLSAGDLEPKDVHDDDSDGDRDDMHHRPRCALLHQPQSLAVWLMSLHHPVEQLLQVRIMCYTAEFGPLDSLHSSFLGHLPLLLTSRLLVLCSLCLFSSLCLTHRSVGVVQKQAGGVAGQQSPNSMYR